MYTKVCFSKASILELLFKKFKKSSKFSLLQQNQSLSITGSLSGLERGIVSMLVLYDHTNSGNSPTQVLDEFTAEIPEIVNNCVLGWHKDPEKNKFPYFFIEPGILIYRKQDFTYESGLLGFISIYFGFNNIDISMSTVLKEENRGFYDSDILYIYIPENIYEKYVNTLGLQFMELEKII